MADFIVSDKILDEIAFLHYYQDRCEIVKNIKKNSQFCPATQCKTCIHTEKRTCMYHGYPEDTIPGSCTYKIGSDARYNVGENYERPIIMEHYDE